MRPRRLLPRRPHGRRLALVPAALLVLLGAASWGAAQAFSDLEASEHPEAVRHLAERGVLSGFPDGTFRPRQSLRRAELTALLVRERGLATVSAETAEACFEDLASGAWYTPAVCAAAGRGWVSGYADGTFRPEAPVSYAEALKLVLQAYDPPPGDAPAAPGEPWYRPFQRWAHERGYLSQYAYDPLAPIPRDRTARLLFLALTGGLPEAPYRSAGCGAAPPAAPPQLLQVGGVERELIARVPESYDPSRPAPLIVAFHGRTSPNGQVRRYYRLEPQFPDAIILYPAGLPSGGAFSWWEVGDPFDGLRDYALFDALLERYGEAYCIDENRVYAVGHSLGASFAFSLACARGERVRAVAGLGGGVQGRDCAAPSAVMVLHNPDDRLVDVSFGEATVELFREEMRLAEPPVPAEAPPLAAFACVVYGEDALHPVAWCPHPFDETASGRYYPHNWPHATAEAIRAFFTGLP